LTLCNIAAAREQLTDIVLINPRFYFFLGI
jgi:hypothetical protein